MTVAKTDERIRREYHSEPVNHDKAMLSMHAESGRVIIETHESPRIEVEARLRGVDLRVWREQDCVFVAVENATDPFPSNEIAPKAEVTVVVPARCELLVHVVTGGVEVKNLAASVRTHVITGQTLLQNLDGRITASSVTGSIAYEGSLADDTHRFVATTGSIQLSLQEPPNARIYAWSTSGRVHCDIPLNHERRGGYPTGDHLYGVAGAGVGRILAEVVTGTVNISDYQSATDFLR